MEQTAINVEQFISALNQGVVEFDFLKENGDFRTAKGTRNVKTILELSGAKPADYYEEAFSNNEDAEPILFFDVERGAIRSVLSNTIVPGKAFWTKA